jgi:hypothetical protein
MKTAILENHTQCWIPAGNENSSGNRLIEAYLKGKKAGMEQYQKLMLSKLEENIEKSGKISLSLMDTLKENNFTPIDAYLRVHSWGRFDIMITVPDEDTMKEEFLDMYDVISNVEQEYKEEFYSIFITFCSVDENFEEQLVFWDGYSLKLKKK